jgi:hypothetical protein
MKALKVSNLSDFNSWINLIIQFNFIDFYYSLMVQNGFRKNNK